MTEKQETMEDRFEEKFTDTFWSEVLTEAHYGDVDTKPFLAFIRNEIQAAVQKARIEVAEEIFNEFDTRLKKDHDVVDIYLLAGLKAKYLSPTQEKDQNKINTRSIDTEDKSKEPK